MTKRAKFVDKFVEDLAKLALKGVHYKCVAFGKIKSPEQAASLKDYEDNITTLKATLCEIVENNEEQAEALMHELGLKWKNSRKT